MTLLVHDEKYEESSHLHTPREWSDLRVDYRRLEPGSLEPVTFTCNSIVVALAGRTPVTRRGDGVSQQAVIQPGMACIEPIGVSENEAEITSSIECLHVNLQPALLSHSALADYDIDPAKVELAYAGGLRDRLLHQIALGLRDVVSRAPQPTDRLLIDGVRSVLAAHLIATYLLGGWRPAAISPTLPHARLRRVIDLIEARFAEAITLHELATEACLSDFHFSRLFRQSTGLSPRQYVTQRRIQEAQLKLKLGHHSLVEIALETGFGSEANFNRAFRKHTGLTPGEFRALYRH